MNLKKSLLVASLALTGLANAQEFSLTGEFRPRTELFGNGFNYRYQNGGNTSGQIGGSAPYVQTSVRAAINATYKTDAYTTYIGVQEVFNFGDRTQIENDNSANIRIQEAWADIKLSGTTTLKIGRQPLSYDDQRILGGLGWAQQARTHDAAVLKYKNDGYSLDLGGSLNTIESNEYNSVANFSYRDMGFLRVNKKYGALNLSLLGLANTYQNGTSDKANLITAGLHADYKSGILKLSANGYIQDGEHLFGGTTRTVDGAFLASLDAVVKVADKTSVLGGVEVISGSDSGEGTTGFFPLYGTNHKFNGYMDRFYVGVHALGSGLVDLNLGVKTVLPGGYALSVKAHNFTEQSNNENALGNELDLVVAKKFNGYKLVGGYSQFFQSDDFPGAASNGRDVQNWAWLMLIIKPKFI